MYITKQKFDLSKILIICDVVKILKKLSVLTKWRKMILHNNNNENVLTNW